MNSIDSKIKTLILAVCLTFVLINTVDAQGDLGVRCFSCGYLIQVNGSKTEIGDGTPLCGDFAEQSDHITEAGDVSVRKYCLLNTTEAKNNAARKLFFSIKNTLLK